MLEADSDSCECEVFWNLVTGTGSDGTTQVDYCQPDCSDYTDYDEATNTCYCSYENGDDYEWFYEDFGHYCWLECYGTYEELGDDNDECVCDYDSYYNDEYDECWYDCSWDDLYQGG